MGLIGKKKEIGPDTIIQRRNDLLFNEIDGEVVMLSIENGEYYGMDKVGTRIWQLIEQPIKYDILIEHLLLDYNIERDKCVDDTSAFLKELINKKLVALS